MLASNMRLLRGRDIEIDVQIIDKTRRAIVGMTIRAWISFTVATVALSTLLVPRAWADNLTIQDPGAEIFQQTQNNPCVIGDPSCKQPAGFGESIIPPNTSPYDVTSATYTVAQLRSLLAGGQTFIMGIDVNTAAGQPTEQLDYFDMKVNGTTKFSFGTGVGDGISHTFVVTNNGNGFSDALLLGFDLTGLADSDLVTFRAVVDQATGGREEFFIVRAGATPVAEPATLLLVGSGLAALGGLGRKRLVPRPAA